MADSAESFLPEASSTLEIEPSRVAAWIGKNPEERPMLIDCREADELLLCKIKGNNWIPLREIPQRFEAIQAGAQRGVVVYCHHGIRSLHAVQFLRSHGLTNAFSMNGGIDLWSNSIDPTVPRY